MNKGVAQAIREYLRKKGRCSLSELRADMPYDNAAIRDALKDFLKRGEIRKLESPDTIYEYVGRKETITKSDRVWRAMRYLPVFSANEIAMLAKVETEYVTDIIKRYKNAGYVAKAGQRKRKHRGGLEMLYTLLNRDLRERPILRQGQSRIYDSFGVRNSGTVPSEE
jgi:DNA-binding MarR family transcriptional regulator